MEISKLLNIAKKYIVYILFLAVVGAVLGFYSASIASDTGVIEKTYFLSFPKSQTPQDAFFLQNQASNTTDMAIAILQSSEYQSKSLSLGTTLSVRKLAPQVIRLSYSGRDTSVLESDVAKTARNFQSTLVFLEGEERITLKPLSDETFVQKPQFNNKVTTIVGMLLGLFSSLFLIAAKEYFKL